MTGTTGTSKLSMPTVPQASRQTAYGLLREEAGRHLRHADVLRCMAVALENYFAQETGNTTEEEMWRWLQSHRDFYIMP